ncbi:MAG: DUF885 domain-containing protein [Steroidobacteraceae bacterium]
MWKSLKIGAALSGVLLLGLASCGQQPPPPGTPKPPSLASQKWDKLTAGFIQSYLDAQPFFAAQSGRHEFDGQLPDVSNHGIRREIARLHDERDQVSAVDPKTLEPRERFDREYLLAVVDRDLFWMEKAKFPFSNPAWYIDKLDPDMYLNRNYASLDVRMKAYIKYARGIPKMVNDIKANLQPPLPRTYVELGIAQYGGLSTFYAKDVAPVFASVSDPDLQKQLSDADAAASQAMDALKQTLEADLKTANDKFALGPDLYAQMLAQTERVDLPVDQIEAAGRADLDRNTAALKAECATYAPKESVQQCVAKMSAHKPKDAVAEAREQLVMLKAFIVKNNVVSIPSDQDALVAEAPPYNRSNAAFIQVPGPYDHGVASVYNIAPPDPKWSKAEQAAYIPAEATLLSTSVHEVWPGHFLQFLHSNANPSKLEALWVGYAYAEGWAHYCEEMMIEKGLAKDDPERHIGQLIDALLRDVRMLSSIGLHTHGMTVAQSEKMFREQAFQDPGNARQQAARGTYDPAYLNYTLGKLMIRKLRTDWVAKHAGAGAQPGDQSLWHDFHDQFLSYGGPPIPLLRKEMLGGDAGSLL